MKKPKLPNLRSLLPQPKARKPMNKLQAHANRLTPSVYEDYEEPTTKLSTAFVVVLVLHLVAVGGIYAFHSIKAKRREADGTSAAVKSSSPTPTTVGSAVTVPAKPSAPVAPAPSVVQPPAPVHAASNASAAPVAAKANATPVKPETTVSHLPAPAGPSAVIPAQKPTTSNAQTGMPQATAGVQTAQVPNTGVSNASNTVSAKAQPASVTPVKAVAVVPAVQPVAAVAVDSAAKTYTVVKGDNPVAIAKKMGVNYDEMLKINGIEDPRKLQIGQVLKMPAKKQGN
jgi:nucleoid-associated protein YgaU